MPAPKIEDSEFVRLFEKIGARGISKHLGISERSVYARRKRVEKRANISIGAPTTPQSPMQSSTVRIEDTIKDGCILVGSDAHYWQDVSTAHLAFVELCKKLKPKMVVLNGDILDGASVSRHPPINWEGTPGLSDELDYVKERLDEIYKASRKAKHYWTLGNHDQRFESRLASVASEYKGIAGLHLKDHFPAWQGCMSLWLNDKVVIKHRFNGGVHARHNNTLKSGKTIVTGHTHQQGCTPYTDYNGTRFGIEDGTMAEPNAAQFEYSEDGPKNWISGFVVLSFSNGELMYPEFVRVMSQGVYEFRGKLYTIEG